jgi:acyl CoA:acetate/3-ketoacid CoA transferase beta subunit
MRGAPGNTINHPTSYWVPNHSAKVFVEKVDVVTGVGYDRARALGASARFHDVRRVISNLGVFDFETDDGRMRLRSLHPGVSVDDVAAATGFELEVAPDLGATRTPSAEELRILRDVLDPAATREREVPAA